MKYRGKSSSRQLRYIIYYTLYRMDPQKTHYKISCSAQMSQIKKHIFVYISPLTPDQPPFKGGYLCSKTLPEAATMTSTKPCNSIFAGVRLREVVVDPVCNAPGAPQSYGLARSPPHSGAQHPFTDRPPNRPKNGFRTASWLLIGSGAPWIPVFAK